MSDVFGDLKEEKKLQFHLRYFCRSLAVIEESDNKTRDAATK